MELPCLGPSCTWRIETVQLEKEGGGPCVLAGQSFGGYVAQAFMSRYKSLVRGFISIDSAPLDRKYYSVAELWLLKHTYRLYMCFPWKLLVKSGSFSCAETEYGRKLMKTMMLSYGKKEYCRLAARGYRLLADALSMKHDIPACPVLLISPCLSRAAHKWEERQADHQYIQ